MICVDIDEKNEKIGIRHKIYRVVHVHDDAVLSIIYKYFMIVVTIASIIPLTLKNVPLFWNYIEAVCLVVFSVDYILRWITADYRTGKKHWISFIKHPLRFIAIIDMLAILALVSPLVGFASGKIFSVFRVVRILRYSKNVRRIIGIFKKSKKSLYAVLGLAIGYILISAIVIFNVEPESFKSFFDAVYWAVVSLTTVGYGDIYPVTTIGRVIAMSSSFFGIAIVALPAGIVTAAYIESMKDDEKK